MNLLILTQKVDKNDDNLGFFCGWILEFAKNCNKVSVVCLFEGEHDFPSNVRVFSLGKESGASKVQQTIRFYRYIWRERKDYDSVFVHMNPIYVVLGGIFWRLIGKRIGLWYTHKHVDLKLRLATILTHVIFTASKESFRIISPKVKVVGHGIDLTIFTPSFEQESINTKKTILSIGRLSPTKQHDKVIDYVSDIAREVGSDVQVIIVGNASTREQEDYKKFLLEKKNQIKNIDIVLKENTPHSDMPVLYKDADLLVNFSQTGSMDKVVLEALACNTPVLTTNEAFEEMLSGAGMYVSENNEQKIKERLVFLLTQKKISTLREKVESNHNLSVLIKKIVSKLQVHVQY